MIARHPVIQDRLDYLQSWRDRVLEQTEVTANHPCFECCGRAWTLRPDPALGAAAPDAPLIVFEGACEIVTCHRCLGSGLEPTLVEVLPEEVGV